MREADLYYKKLKGKSIFLYDFCNELIKDFSIEKREKLPHGYNVGVFGLSESISLKEPIIKKINEKFNIKHTAIAILEKNRGYPFHIDGFRKVGINMLLSSGVSHSIFKKRQINQKQYEFEELVYQEKTFYLYNTEMEHAMINFDKPRYLLSLMPNDPNLTYNELFKWCKENNLLEN